MKKSILIAFAAVLLFSCSKDDENKPIVYPDYANLKVGNYWVYQHFFIDTTGADSALDVYDSCYVEKDTIINGNTYYKMVRPHRILQSDDINYYRDSLDYLVDRAGKIWFSAEDFTTVFDTYYSVNPIDTTYTINYMMVDKDKQVTTPAGDFVTRTFQRRIDFNKKFVYWYSPRYSISRYSKDVGIVCETLEFFSTDPNYVERRLVRYGNALN